MSTSTNEYGQYYQYDVLTAKLYKWNICSRYIIYVTRGWRLV